MTKGLREFEKFDSNGFLKDKVLRLMKSEVLQDYSTNKPLGSQYTIIVEEDHTKYQKEDTSNLGDRYVVKVLDKEPLKITSPVFVKLIEPEIRIYGDFRNNIAISAKDIQIINRNKNQ